jgi:hypothetical protein
MGRWLADGASARLPFGSCSSRILSTALLPAVHDDLQERLSKSTTYIV